MGYNAMEVQDLKIIRFVTEDSYRLWRHVMLLLGILAMLAYSKQVNDYNGTVSYLKIFVVYVPLIFMFYININLLVPLYFFKGRYVIYFILVILLVVLSINVISYILSIFFPKNISAIEESDSARRGFYEPIIILIPILLVTTMIKLFQRWMKDSQRIAELNSITFNMELNELRNQINPHFLFNTLNGIKSLLRIDPDKAGIVIMKLSEFLRYQLYENNDQYTLLKSEINFLTNFLDLEKLRRENLRVEINSQSDSQTIGSIFIPPNLFTTFVENAVKHNVDINDEESFVQVTILIRDNVLYFNCVNSIDLNFKPSTMGKSNGLGLANIKRRLELLYGDKHTLDIVSTKTRYEIKLVLPL